MRADVDAAVVADEFIAVASCSAQIGPLSAERVEETAVRLLRGIAA
ncbi:hypothetical protein [Microbacterium paraoxydans]